MTALPSPYKNTESTNDSIQLLLLLLLGINQISSTVSYQLPSMLSLLLEETPVYVKPLSDQTSVFLSLLEFKTEGRKYCTLKTAFLCPHQGDERGDLFCESE